MQLKRILLALSIFLSLSISPLYAEIKVGTVYFDPPFVMSSVQGFDVQLIQLLCTRMQEKCLLIPMDFHSLFDALNSGKIDLAIGGIPISLHNLDHYIFSLPYLLSLNQFLALNNSRITAIKDLRGKKVGVIKGRKDGSVFYNYLKQHYTKQFTIVEYNDMEDLISALSQAKIAAAFLHQSTAQFWEQNGGNQFHRIGKAVAVGNGIAIMALPANAALIARINQQLVGIEKDKSYLTLYHMYFPHQ